MHCFSKSLIVIRRYIHSTFRAANDCCQSLTQYKKELDDIRSSIDQAEAQRLNRGYKTDVRNIGPRPRNINNMAPSDRMRPNNARKNPVIEGLKGRDKAELTAYLLKMATDIGAIIYSSDKVNIFRMRRKDETNSAPGPVLVSFNRISITDNIMKKKANLRYIMGM